MFLYLGATDQMNKSPYLYPSSSPCIYGAMGSYQLLETHRINLSAVQSPAMYSPYVLNAMPKDQTENLKNWKLNEERTANEPKFDGFMKEEES